MPNIKDANGIYVALRLSVATRLYRDIEAAQLVFNHCGYWRNIFSSGTKIAIDGTVPKKFSIYL